MPLDVPVLAVGWLGAHPPEVGSVPEACIDRLFEAYQQGQSLSDGTMGWHDCEMCDGDEAHYPGGRIGPVISWRSQELRLYGHGHHLILHGDSVYMCPVLILHYILDHHYAPPDEFVQAVTNGRFLLAG